MAEVIVVIGSGSIGQAIARRVSAGRHVLLVDRRPDIAQSRFGRAGRRSSARGVT